MGRAIPRALLLDSLKLRCPEWRQRPGIWACWESVICCAGLQCKQQDATHPLCCNLLSSAQMQLATQWCACHMSSNDTRCTCALACTFHTPACHTPTPGVWVYGKQVCGPYKQQHTSTWWHSRRCSRQQEGVHHTWVQQDSTSMLGQSSTRCAATAAHLEQHKVERDRVRLLVDDVHAPCRATSRQAIVCMVAAAQSMATQVLEWGSAIQWCRHCLHARYMQCCSVRHPCT
jgi:hypothetical protein